LVLCFDSSSYLLILGCHFTHYATESVGYNIVCTGQGEPAPSQASSPSSRRPIRSYLCVMWDMLNLDYEWDSDFLFRPYLSMKQGSFVCTLDIFLISLESSRWVRSRGGPRTWLETVWSYGVESYLIIEPFSEWKLNKIKTENCIGIGGNHGVIAKTLVSQI
jgi:hypothetical protein